ncbi:hypothetical protein ACQPZP_20155 [Spirillospora sp. CA-142024]|uniref:hypothetical protein n=1 Tax=Spirillospora sp. CA-142024 TaxID=3240036 RepID=UPI003D8AF3EA
MAQAAREAEEFAGEPVDVPDFIGTLRGLGFVEPGPGEPAAGGRAAAKRRCGRASRS